MAAADAEAHPATVRAGDVFEWKTGDDVYRLQARAACFRGPAADRAWWFRVLAGADADLEEAVAGPERANVALECTRRDRRSAELRWIARLPLPTGAQGEPAMRRSVPVEPDRDGPRPQHGAPNRAWELIPTVGEPFLVDGHGLSDEQRLAYPLRNPEHIVNLPALLGTRTGVGTAPARISLFELDVAMDLLDEAGDAPDPTAVLAAGMREAIGPDAVGATQYAGAAAASLVADAWSGTTPEDPHAQDWSAAHRIRATPELVDLAKATIEVARDLAEDDGFFVSIADAVDYGVQLDEVARRLDRPAG